MKVSNGRGTYTQSYKTGLIPALIAGAATYILVRIEHARGWKVGEDCGYLYGLLESTEEEMPDDVEVGTF